jgi:hypothetical protein
MMAVDAADRLRDALGTELTANHPPNLAALQPLVAEYVAEKKEAQWTPEHILLGVKAIARDAGLISSHRVISRDILEGRDALLGHVIRWVLDAYFGTRGSAEGPTAY